MIQLDKYKIGLTNLCEENKVVKKLYFFGSALTPRFNETSSDIDVLIETEDLAPEEKGEYLIILWDDLEKLFNRKIDLLTENSLQNPFLKKEIEQTRKLIYDGQSKQIFV
ncbi:MAG: nucleotidyltransferase domain-containing protein [Candidatus Symbiothrix sp.]|jgi:predicted nucleotidyltransferase|nr:nucleotidyltransferase domain-containing protein [Candidatus Symbiothrix sp.]